MLRFILLHAWREKSNPEFRILAFALAIAVMAITALTELTTSIEHLLSQEGSSLLGGDLLLESSSEISPFLIESAQKNGLQASMMVEFFSMVAKGENLQIANVLAFYQPYPLQGQLVLSSKKERHQLKRAPPPLGEIWVDESLATLLNLALEDVVSIGNAQFKVSAWIKERPIATSGTGALAPFVFVNAQDVGKMQVLQRGSRATYRLLLTGKSEDINLFQERFAHLPNIKWISPKEGRTGINRTFSQAQSYLSIILFVQVLLASLAIAMCAHQYVSRQTRQVALMRCLGTTTTTVLYIEGAALLFYALIILLGSVALGYLIAFLALQFAKQYGIAMINLSWQGGVWGASIGLSMLLGFALPPFLQLKKVSAVKILQQTEDELAHQSALNSFLIFAVVGLLLAVFFHHNDLILRLSAQMCIVAAFTFVLAWGVWSLFSPLSRFGTLAWRFGLGFLVRHKAQALLQWLIFTLVLTLLLLTHIIQKEFILSWQKQLPPETPNYFLINIQANQVEALQQWLSQNGLKKVDFFPIVPGRMSHINGQALDDSEENKTHRGLSRPINLTWMNLGQSGLSIEQGFAIRQNLKIGDTLSFEIGENRVTGQISQIRSVDWSSLKPNFFVIFPPGLLEKYPYSFMTSLYVPVAKKEILSGLAHDYVEISIIDIDAILLKVRQMIAKLSMALEGLLIIVLILGGLIFYANLLSTLKERLQESAMLQIFGANRRLILTILLIEFMIMGLLSGAVASVMALLLAQDIAQHFFSMSLAFDSKWLVFGIIASMSLMGILGLWGARSVLTVSPLYLLRKTT